MEDEIQKPTKKRIHLLYPLKWIWNRYVVEFKEWSSPTMMTLYFLTQLVVFPTILFTGMAVFNYHNLPDDKFKFLFGAFGLTATIAGLSNINLYESENFNLKIARIQFTFTSLSLLILTAVVFLIDYYSGDKAILHGFARVLVGILKVYYSILIVTVVLLWIRSFGVLNKALWYYLYNDKYHRDRQSEEDSESDAKTEEIEGSEIHHSS